MSNAAPSFRDRSIFIQVHTTGGKLWELRRLNGLDAAEMNILGVEVEEIDHALYRSIHGL